MDPNTALERMLEGANVVLSGADSAQEVVEMCEPASDLANWLRGGGFMPAKLPAHKRGALVGLADKAEALIDSAEVAYSEEEDGHGEELKDLLERARRHVLPDGGPWRNGALGSGARVASKALQHHRVRAWS